jgi:hypothetical protein
MLGHKNQEIAVESTKIFYDMIALTYKTEILIVQA